ncbi:hypothetical protein Fmac_003038 [Flemingia macrophylla]|uniref:DOMON domain-containing protein n=1 Tax=Flemingia macrophylla TaxID=520843 RepID=A0ABD1NNE8_9FABA
MVGESIVVRLVLCMSVLISLLLTSSAQTCKSQTFTNNKVFTSCSDLPHLSSYLHWTYNQSTGKLDLAFRHSQITAPDRWVAWAINPDNNLNSAMIGAQALVAISQSSGAPTVYTSSIASYSTQLAEGNISYAHSGLSATRENSEITIYAILTLPMGTTSLVHLWQDGPLSGSTPQIHNTSSSNLQAKQNLHLLSGSAPTPAPAPAGSNVPSLSNRINVAAIHVLTTLSVVACILY